MKTEHNVLGYQMNCINYVKCPFCYGCRNYNSQSIECEQCAKDFKKNICDTSKHLEKSISKLILKPKIIIPKEKINE